MSENNTKTSAEKSDKKINQARSFTYYILLWLLPFGYTPCGQTE